MVDLEGSQKRVNFERVLGPLKVDEDWPLGGSGGEKGSTTGRPRVVTGDLFGQPVPRAGLARAFSKVKKKKGSIMRSDTPLAGGLANF